MRTTSGEEFADEMTGVELEWDFATERARIGELFPLLPWPQSKLDALVETVAHLEQQPNLTGLIAACAAGR